MGGEAVTADGRATNLLHPQGSFGPYRSFSTIGTMVGISLFRTFDWRVGSSGH